MALRYSLINRITNVGKSNDDLILKVRVVREYKLHAPGNTNQVSSYELVCHDHHGDRIHGTIRHVDFRKYKLKFVVGSLYAFHRFDIKHNDMRYRTTTSMFRFVSNSDTSVAPIDDDTFPSNMFVFRPFLSILDRSQYVENKLFDVIAKIAFVDDPQTKNRNGRDSVLVDVHLKNIEGESIVCTIWGKAVDEILRYWGDTSKHPLIIVLQMCRSKVFNGVVCIANTFDITNMLLDAEIPEISDFRERLLQKGDSEISVSSQSGTSNTNVDFDISSGHQKLITIRDLLENNYTIGTCWIYGRTGYVTSKGSWFYLSCTRCNRKISKVGEKFFCDKCNKSYANGSMKYKLIISVSDDTEDTLLMLWNKECVELIGKTATELSAHYTDDNKNFDLPDEITSLVDRDVMFKIRIKDAPTSEKPINVVAINLDSNVISKYCGMRSSSKEKMTPDLLSLLASSEFVDEKHCDSELPIDCSNDATPTAISANGNHDLKSLKRNLDDQFLTTTVNLKKKKYVMKLEKD